MKKKKQKTEIKEKKVEREYPLDSIHRTGGWERQLVRVSRWMDRLLNANSADDAEDFLYAFFQNAHHLRDWSAGGKTTDEIDEFLSQHLATRMCRDVANMTKHSKLTRPPSQGREPCIYREHAVNLAGWYEQHSRLVIVTNCDDDGVTLDAREVAKECLRLWCVFLSPNARCDSIVSQFKLSATAFDNLVSEARARTALIRRVIGP